MAEVTVISPNVVELLGSLATPARAAPQPAPRDDPALKSRDPAGGGSRGLAANGNAIPAPPRPEIRDRPKSSAPPAPRPERPPSQPSTTFLTQLLAQRSDTGNIAAKRFDTAIAAYEQAGAGRPDTAPSGVAFLTRTVDREI